MARSTTKIKGFAILEILISMTIFTLFSVGIFYLSLDSLQRDGKIETRSDALNYVQEGIEAVRSMRDRNFLLLTNGDHGLILQADLWSFIAAPENIDNFYSRTITINDVYRDANGDISNNGGTLDPDIKKIISEVTWTEKGIFPKSMEITTYLTNWTGDDIIETTCTEFDDGTFDTTETTPTPEPPANNCAIQLDLVESQSSFFSSANIGDHGNDVDINGNYAYVANNKTNTGFTVVNVTNRQSPSVIKNLDIEGKGRYITYDDNYAYVGVQKSSKGLAIINVTDPANATISSKFNIGDYGNAIAVSGNYLYMGIEEDTNSFKVVNITNKAAPTIAATLDFDAIVQEVHINGNYAYVGLEDDFEGFRIVNISNPASPQKISALDIDEEVNSIKIQGPYAYVGIEDSANSLKVIDISNPAIPLEIASLNVNGEIKDLTISGNYLYAALDDTNAGLAAINIENPASPVLLYNLDINGKGSGIDSDASYIYISTDTANQGMVIVGTTVSQYTNTGTYISSAINTGSDSTRYNFIEWEHTEVPGSSVKFQIRTANNEANLQAATWVGTDGTNATFYENSRTAIILDPANSGVQYIQFKGIIESDGVSTPTIESVRINYTP